MTASRADAALAPAWPPQRTRTTGGSPPDPPVVDAARDVLHGTAKATTASQDGGRVHGSSGDDRKVSDNEDDGRSGGVDGAPYKPCATTS